MAKALLGHLGGPDTRLLAEVRRLRRRVRDLETELRRVNLENDRLSAALADEHPVLVELEQEPALV